MGIVVNCESINVSSVKNQYDSFFFIYYFVSFIMFNNFLSHKNDMQYNFCCAILMFIKYTYFLKNNKTTVPSIYFLISFHLYYYFLFYCRYVTCYYRKYNDLYSFLYISLKFRFYKNLTMFKLSNQQKCFQISHPLLYMVPDIMYL